MNLTEKDFLPAVKQLLPTMSDIAAQKVGHIANMPYDVLAKSVIEALQGLKSVSVAYYELANPEAGKITQFYVPKIGLTKGWNPIVRMESPQGSFRLYAKPELEEMFSLAVAPKGYVVVHTTGPIDMTRLAELAAKIIPEIMSRRPAPKTEPAPEPVPAP